MQVAQACTRNVVGVEPSCTVSEAARIMRKRHVGTVVVFEAGAVGRSPIGLLTDRDIVVSVVAPGISPDVITVGDVMSLPLYTFGEEADLLDAIRCMRDKGVRRLVILDRAGDLAGILSLDDAYSALTSQLADLRRAVGREQVRESVLRT